MSEMPTGYGLYNRTLNSTSKKHKKERDSLRQSFLSARKHVSFLIASIHTQLKGLTVHDISHVDSLWRLAEEIIGPKYPLNEAEAYVLGCAFLLHDSAHTKEAFTGGIAAVKDTVVWRDLIGQTFDQKDPLPDSAEEQQALFFALRHLHAEQAKALPKQQWSLPGSDEPIYIFEDFDLREYYGDLIGELAASHHWSASEVLEAFEKRVLSPPPCLESTRWDVDALKLAFILRTADAAHLDAKRAPWFLFALHQPQGVSQDHWRFQAKMGIPRLTNGNELTFTAGSGFDASEKRAWWLAYDTINMVDKELRHAHSILGEFGRTQFAAERVTGAGSAELFSKHLRTSGWEPIDTSSTISNIPSVIANLGGAALYGEHPYVAIRELMQNSADAIRALRSLEYLEPHEGKITVALDVDDDSARITVKDNGLGMSKFVLTRVLTDFGTSLWKSAQLSSELPGLASTSFKSVGKFGIGFFSVFMLGEQVSIITRRFEPKAGEESQWKMHYEHGLSDRATVSLPSMKERLKHQGTEITVHLDASTLSSLLRNPKTSGSMDYFDHDTKLDKAGRITKKLERLVKTIFPMTDIDVYCQYNGSLPQRVMEANDWKTIPKEEIYTRTTCEPSHLIPISDKQGNLLGKLDIAERYHSHIPASITYQGIWCGQLNGLKGFIATASNNLEANRHDGAIVSDLENWEGWASAIVAHHTSLSLNKLLALHPLIPGHDLPVWRVGGSFRTRRQLKALLHTTNTITVYYGDLQHEAHDAMSADAFDSNLTLDRNFICVPHFMPVGHPQFTIQRFRRWTTSNTTDFPWSLGAAPINYLDALSTVIKDVWGTYREDEEEEMIIGHVNRTPLTREVSIYSKI